MIGLSKYPGCARLAKIMNDEMAEPIWKMCRQTRAIIPLPDLFQIHRQALSEMGAFPDYTAEEWEPVFAEIDHPDYLAFFRDKIDGMLSKEEREMVRIMDEVREKKKPDETAVFAKQVFRWLDKIPLMVLFKETPKDLTPAQEFEIRNWIFGVPGADRPAYIRDDVPLEVLESARRLLELNPL